MSNQLVAKLSSFKRIVCKECGICDKNNNPSFCYLFMLRDKTKFIQYVVRAGKIEEKSKTIDKKFLRSAGGFFELMCNKSVCSNYKVAKCERLKQKVTCYAAWCTDWSQSEAIASTILLHKKEDLVGIRNKNLISQAWIGLSNKKKKQLKKNIKTASKLILRNFPTTVVTAPVETIPITTTTFHDNDEKWIQHINAVLSE